MILPKIKGRKRIGVALSGGSDSAILMHIACLENPDATFYPMHLLEDRRPNTIWHARDVLDFLREYHPNVKIEDFTILEWSSKPGSKHKNAAIEDPGDLPKRPDGHNGQAKILAGHELRHRMFSEIKCDQVIYGSTANPPLDVCEQIGISREESRRDKGKRALSSKGGQVYTPFVDLDKKDLKDLYIRYDVLETLFPLTASCVGFAKDTNMFTEPCKKCYWCKEKMWAFGTYDLA